MTDHKKPRRTREEHIAQLQAKARELAAKATMLKKQEAGRTRALETQRKILLGVAFLAELEEQARRQSVPAAVLADAVLRRRLSQKDLASPAIADLLKAGGSDATETL